MIKQNKTEVIYHTFYDEEETEITPADVGEVTVTITDSAGGEVEILASKSDDEVYSITLPSQAALGKLTLDWVSDTHQERTYEEIVSENLFELFDLDVLRKAQGDSEQIGVKVKRDLRAEMVDLCEVITGSSFVKRRKTVTVPVINGYAFLPTVGVHQVVTVNGSPHTGAWGWSGVVEGLTGDSAVVTYDYCHFADGVPTGDVRQAALELAVHELKTRISQVPANAETSSTEGGDSYRHVHVGTRGINVEALRANAVISRYIFNLSRGVG